jgi:hypothetical protein
MKCIPILEHCFPGVIAIHPGGMAADSPGSRSVPGDYERNIGFDPEGIAATRPSTRPLRPLAGSVGLRERLRTPGALRDPGLIATTPPGSNKKSSIDRLIS